MPNLAKAFGTEDLAHGTACVLVQGEARELGKKRGRGQWRGLPPLGRGAVSAGVRALMRPGNGVDPDSIGLTTKDVRKKISPA